MPHETVFTAQSGATWRYWSDQPLGKPGGFGGVYAAAAEDGTPMAVKVVDKVRQMGVLDDRLLRREVEIGRRVAESGGDLLLPVIDVAETNNHLLLVMARADGGALADQALPLDDPAVRSVLLDIVAGLHQLHSIGIIHRDLKPGNVLKDEGHWKLADFGIARDEEIGTQNPTFLGWGSPPYMAPELWEGKSPTVKTDLYALGCVGFELLKGEPPYTGAKAALRNAHISQPVPDVPTGNVVLRNLVVRLLAKDPGERPQDARAVMERLRRAAVPRSPVQEAIAKGLGVHVAERSLEASRKAADEADEMARGQQLIQAQADLDEIMGDACEDLQQIEPDAKLAAPVPSGRGRHVVGTSTMTLTTSDARLRLEIWEQGGYDAVPRDTMILAGAVIITNRRFEGELNAANLVYEQMDDRLGWQVYRFRATSMASPEMYTFGPSGRTHGLKYEDFFGQGGRYFMVNPATHVWQKSTVQLTSESLLDLFHEAVELRSPEP